MATATIASRRRPAGFVCPTCERVKNTWTHAEPCRAGLVPVSRTSSADSPRAGLERLASAIG